MNFADLSKDALMSRGLSACNHFLNANDITQPRYRWVQRGPDRGWYRPNVVTINLPRCRPPTRTPGFAWSFPGYKADMTVFGVLAHEVGHHVDYERNSSGGIYDAWLGKPVSGYEPNDQEAFAESVRLLITNPDLLKVGRPLRWSFLIDELGLMPTIHSSWRDTLEERGAHPKFIRAAENWIKIGRRS